MKNKTTETDIKKMSDNEQSAEDIGNDLTDGFDDGFGLYENMDSGYHYNDFDGADDEKSSADDLVSEGGQNSLVVKGNDSAIMQPPKAKPVKVREIAMQPASSKVNAFDLFFLRLWAAMVSLLGYVAKGINAGIFAIFKRKLPLKYIKAFLVVLIIVLLFVAILVPVASNSHSSGGGEQLVVFQSNMVPVLVRVDDGTGDPVYKWGYLDKNKAPSGTGKDSLAIAAQYEEALPFNKYGIAWVRVKNDKGHYWELINSKAKRVGERTYPVSTSSPIGTRPFGEFTDSKLAWVNENGKYGYIDTKGNVKIQCDLDVAGDFIDGIARVGRGNYEWYINKSGKAVGRAFDYIKVLDFSCGLGAVNKGGRWGFVDRKGKEVIELKYDAVSQFVEGYAMVKMGKTFGLINTKGESVINTQWYYDIVIKNPIFEEFLQQNSN